MSKAKSHVAVSGATEGLGASWSALRLWNQAVEFRECRHPGNPSRFSATRDRDELICQIGAGYTASRFARGG
jgi:hypothetical protein